MKEIEVKVSGRGDVYYVESVLDMSSVDTDCTVYQLEEDGITDMDSLLEISVILSDVDVIVNGESIVKNKGKYLKTKDYYSKMISNPSFATRMRDSYEMEESFIIILNDDEEFDPKKLQLVKTDYELDFLPYGILTDYIVYDGKKIESQGLATDGLWYKESQSYIIDYDLPYC